MYAEEFHVFSIIWDESAIKFLRDDVQYHIIDITNPNLSAFHQNFFLILNVAVGGNWPGSPNASTLFPQTMAVDYVRVFQ
jgi:beta-glucanase (GH16 family)